MKTYRILSIALALTALSCSREEIKDTTVKGQENADLMEFAICAQSVPLSKITTDGSTVNWSEGDQLVLYCQTPGVGLDPVTFIYEEGYFRGAVPLEQGHYKFNAIYSDMGIFYETEKGVRVIVNTGVWETSTRPFDEIARYDLLASSFEVDLPAQSPVSVDMHHLTGLVEAEIVNSTDSVLNLSTVQLDIPGSRLAGYFDVDFDNARLTECEEPTFPVIETGLDSCSVKPGESAKVYFYTAPVDNLGSVAEFVVKTTDRRWFRAIKDIQGASLKAGEISRARVELVPQDSFLVYIDTPENAMTYAGSFFGYEGGVQSYSVRYNCALDVAVMPGSEWITIETPQLQCAEGSDAELRISIPENKGDYRSGYIIFRAAGAPVHLMTIGQDEYFKAGIEQIAAAFTYFGRAIGSDYHDDFGYPSLMIGLDSHTEDFVSGDEGYNWFSDCLLFRDVIPGGRSTAKFWTTLYNQIEVANVHIKRADPQTQDNVEKFGLAQAYAVRAFDYFNLVQRYQFTYFGNEDKPAVPVITEKNMEEASANGIARSSVAQVYAQILSDLDAAEACLKDNPTVRSDKRYVDLATLYGLKARVFLVMNRFAEAAQYADLAIQASSAVPTAPEDFAPAFNDANEPNWMWGIVITGNDEVATTAICNFPSFMCNFNYGYAGYVGSSRSISPKLYEKIPATDVRRGWWLDENANSPIINENQQIWMKNYMGFGAYENVKFGNLHSDMDLNYYPDSDASADVPLMRIEEMYYIQAEAAFKSGMVTDAVRMLNTFVQTCRDPSFATTESTFLEDIDIQRRVEFWGEGIAYFDVLRHKKGIDRRGCGFPAAAVFNIAADDRTLLYSIPTWEISANPLLVPDTPQPQIPQPVAE